MTDQPASNPREWISAIQENIHPDAWWAIDDWERFPWHTSRGQPDGHVPHSSQAFCISVWGSIAHPESSAARLAVAPLLDSAMGQAMSSPPELALEYVDRSLLNEYGGVATNIRSLMPIRTTAGARPAPGQAEARTSPLPGS